nr:hypothetical protein B0A51_00627 [Rachicladosporium sp. CCFEE 5018]
MALTFEEQAAEKPRQVDEQLRQTRAQAETLIVQRKDAEAALSRCKERIEHVQRQLNQVQGERDQAVQTFDLILKAQDEKCDELDQELAGLFQTSEKLQGKGEDFTERIERLQLDQGNDTRIEAINNEFTGSASVGGGHRMPKHVMDFLVAALRMLAGEDASAFFRQPVDDIAVSDYFDVIVHPMELSTLELHLRQYKYATVAALQKDFDLIHSNSLLYNGDNNEVTDAAEDMAMQFAEYLKDLPSTDPAVRSNIHPGVPDKSRPSEQAVHGLPIISARSRFSMHPKTGTDDNMMAGSRAAKVLRRPTTLSASKERWDDMEPRRKATVHHAGMIYETEAGELAAERCTRCEEKKQKCKVYKEADDKTVSKKRTADPSLDDMTSGSVLVTKADIKGVQLASGGVVGSRKQPRRSYAIPPVDSEDEY